MPTSPSLTHALDALAQQDEDVARAIASYGYPQDRSMPQTYESLAKIIIGQQISRAAASSIWARLQDAGYVTADSIATIDAGALQAHGLSAQKANYLHGLAVAVVSGELDLSSLPHMSGQEVHDLLVSFKGVGSWTADNYRLFALGDFDAWPGNDIALQEAMRRMKSLATRPNAKEMIALAHSWRPYRGAGALFLWHLYGVEVRGAAVSDI